VKPSLSVVIDAGQLERTQADLAVATFFESDRPLRGDAGRADWRLCGLLSDLVATPQLRGRIGEAVLVHTGGKLRARRLLLLGLGAAHAFGAHEAKAAARDGVLRAVGLGVRSLALPLPGHWSARLPIPSTAAAVLRGAAAAVEETGATIEVRLVVPPGAASKALSGLDAMAQQLAGGAVAIRISAEDPTATFAPREFVAREEDADRPASTLR
jgi:hypothetical protein